MPKKVFQRIAPCPKKVKENKLLNSIFGQTLLRKELWHLNRRNVAGGFAVGVFCAFLLIPFQMVVATLAAILFRVNLVFSVGLVFLTNPLTIPPVAYGAYKLGETLMGLPPTEVMFSFNFLMSGDWLGSRYVIPLLLGMTILGVISSMLAFFSVRCIWKVLVIRQRKLHYKNRHL